MSVAKGEKDRTSCVCNKAHCSSITDSPAVSGARGVRGGERNVAALGNGTTEDGVADSVQGERKQSKTAFFLVT